jgi:hypothetical protein
MFLQSVAINKKDYNDWLRSNNQWKEVNKFFDNIDDEDEEYIWCYKIKFSSSLQPYLYNVVWLVDINLDAGLYAPIIVERINTSSAYALWSCGFDDVLEDEDLKEITMEELLEKVPKRSREGLREMIENF